ncbi:MAG: succinylglutamate desuccinylase/aspartoacylase family protein [Roseomonas sp.]|nr:succinylglutamate desuccinylase/aspartoacylase family protein [Roseomonas sp.]
MGTQSTSVEAGGKAVPHFAVGLAKPDLRPWLGGNCGIPGVWSFTAAAPGPHLALVALTHGNEIAGAIVLAEMLAAGIRPEGGRLSLIFANTDAFLAFDAENPTAARYLEEDLNRLWGEDRLQSPRDSREMRRVRALIPVIESVDMLVDLHSMLWPSEPLMLVADTHQAIRFGQALGTPRLTVADPGHIAGRRLVDHARFTTPGSSAAAVLVEAGQHWEAATVGAMTQSVRRALGLCGILGAAPAPWPEPPLFARVTETVTATSHNFMFLREFRGGEVIPEAGTVIAQDGAREIRTPHDDCLLVMPTPIAPRGHTAVRLARFEAPP